MNARGYFATLTLLALAAPAGAGTFLQFGSSQPTTIVHPNGTTGAGGEFMVEVCLDPNAKPGHGPTNPNDPNTALDCSAPGADPTRCNPEQAIRNAVAAYNRDALLGNVDTNNTGHVDFESALMHEAGHCVGMGHNALGPSELVTNNFSNPQLYFANAKRGTNNVFDTNAGADGIRGTRDDVRGDDVNFAWFRKNVNDPWALPSGTIDRNTFSVNLADLPAGFGYVEISTSFGPCNSGQPNSSTPNAQPATQNTMFPVLCTNRLIRDMAPDDLSTLRVARSGFDGTQGTTDDYVPRLQYVGQTGNCDIVVQFVSNAGFAFCQTGGSSGGSIPAGNIVITSGSARFQNTVDWFFNQEDTTGGGGGALSANLSIGLNASTANARPGEVITYTLTITNAGPDAAIATVVNDPTQEGFLFVSNSGDCTTAFPCALGDLPSGATREITTLFRVDPSHSGGGSIDNSVSISSSTDDNALTDNSATQSVTIWAPQSDLIVTVSDGGAQATPGGQVTYDIGVTNLGPSDATSLSLTFDLPTDTTFASDDDADWLCSSDATTVTCTRTSLATGASAPFSLTIDIPPSYTGPDQLTTATTITAATLDPNVSNNSAADTPSPRIFCGNFEVIACSDG